MPSSYIRVPLTWLPFVPLINLTHIFYWNSTFCFYNSSRYLLFRNWFWYFSIDLWKLKYGFHKCFIICKTFYQYSNIVTYVYFVALNFFPNNAHKKNIFFPLFSLFVFNFLFCFLVRLIEKYFIDFGSNAMCIYWISDIYSL